MTGIYCIRHNDKFYVGQSIHIERRWRHHLKLLTSDTHFNPRLQSAFNAHGPGDMHFEVLELCEPAQMTELEQHWMDTLDAYKSGYNCRPAASSTRGLKSSAETRAKISAAGKGRVLSAETRARMSAASKGRPKSPAHRRAIAASISGKTQTAETRAKRSQTMKGRPGRIPTDEERAKMSESARRKPPVSDETRAKLSAAGKRRYAKQEDIVE